MFKTVSNRLEDFPFQSYENLITVEQLSEQAQTHRLSNYNSWMLPQIAAYYGKWKPVWVGEKICPRMTARENMQTSWDVGLWRVVTQLKRGLLVQSQNLPEFVNYSLLVPIILMGLKRYQNIPYASWDLQPNDTLVEQKLLESMMYRDCEVLTTTPQELLEIRELGLTVKSGDRQGKINKPTNQWCLRGVRMTRIGTAPTLVQTMLTQIWVCHPSLRTNLMVLDPQHWDQIPPPLIQAEVLDHVKTKTVIKPSQKTTLLPWEV